jgi:glycosyltransferase involved in cell wall biosynthesis
MLMRVLHYSTWQIPCGIAGYAEDLVAELDRLGCDNTVRPIPAVPLSQSERRREWDALCEQAGRHDVLHIQHEFGLFRGSGASLRDSNKAFCRLLTELQRMNMPTVITFHTGFASLSSLIPRRFGRVLRFSKRISSRYERALTNRIFNWRPPAALMRNESCFRAVVHSARTMSELVDRGIHPALVNVLPIGISAAESGPVDCDQARAREMLGLPRNAVLMSIFGFVSEYKGHLLAKQALALLPENYHLVVVGGPHPEATDYTLNKLLEDPDGKLASRLHVTGYVSPEQSKLYKQAVDIVLAPYRDRNQSGSAAINWGLSSGKPVIAANIPAFREINRRRPCLSLVTPEAEHELAWQIRRVATTPALRQELVDAARAYVEESSCAAVAASTYRIYTDLARRQASVTLRRAA